MVLVFEMFAEVFLLVTPERKKMPPTFTGDFFSRGTAGLGSVGFLGALSPKKSEAETHCSEQEGVSLSPGFVFFDFNRQSLGSCIASLARIAIKLFRRVILK